MVLVLIYRAWSQSRGYNTSTYSESLKLNFEDEMSLVQNAEDLKTALSVQVRRCFDPSRLAKCEPSVALYRCVSYPSLAWSATVSVGRYSLARMVMMEFAHFCSAEEVTRRKEESRPHQEPQSRFLPTPVLRISQSQRDCLFRRRSTLAPAWQVPIEISLFTA